MTMEWESAPYGRAAARRLHAAVAAAKGGNPLRPVTVIVPSNHVGVAVRRLLASGELGPLIGSGTGLAAVTFLTLYRMAELLGAPSLAASGRRPVSTPVIAAAIRRALHEGAGMFSPVARHPATETALVAAYRELRDLPVAALSALGDSSRRASDVVRLHDEARRHLAALFYDEEDLITSVIERLDTDQGSLDDDVVAYLPQRLTCHGARLLEAVGRRSRLIVVAGTTGDERADQWVERSLRRLARSATDTVPDRAPVASPATTSIVITSDADEEVREAVREVLGAVRRGVPLERIAILHATAEPYARLIHEQLEAADVAHNGTSVLSLGARMAGRALLGLLALPGRGYRREDVFAWLAATPLHRQGLPVPVVTWERLSRAAGVVAGREQWDRRLLRHAVSLEEDARRCAADSEVPDWRSEQASEEAEQARSLHRWVLGWIDGLEAASSHERPWSERARWALGCLDELCGSEPRRARLWPASEHKAAQRVTQSLQRLGALDAVEDSVSLEVFTAALREELDDDMGRVGRMGEGVLVGSVAMGAGLDLDVVLIVGLAEGSYPHPVREDSLLPDGERRVTEGLLCPKADEVVRQYHDLLAAMAASTRQVLFAPRGDLRRTSERSVSRWVLDMASRFAGTRLTSSDLEHHRALWLRPVPSFEAGLRLASLPATAQEYRLRWLMSRRSDSRTGSATRLLRSLGDPVLTVAAEAVSDRHSAHFTRFDGHLENMAVPSPVDDVTSATRLESWVRCPFSYFMAHVLKVDVVENPEDRLTISPLDRGTLVHEILEDFVKRVLARPLSEQPAAGEVWRESDWEQLSGIIEEHCDRYQSEGRVGRQLFWERDKRRLRLALHRFLSDDSRARAAHRCRPVAAEFGFGHRPGAAETVTVALPDGRAVRFRGKADRVDRTEDGSLVVIDYKTGKPRDLERLSAEDPDASGHRFQLPVYGLAARGLADSNDVTVRAEYWFISSEKPMKAIGYQVTDDIVIRIGQRLALVVEAMEAGVYPPQPSEDNKPFIDCHYCDPDGFGLDDLRRLRARKEQDPAWARHAAVTAALPGEAHDGLETGRHSRV